MNRRSFLQSVAISPIGLSAQQFAYTGERLPDISVEELEVFRVKVNRRGNWTIVRLHGSRGLTGLGDASQSGQDDETIAHLKELAAILKGCAASSMWNCSAKLQVRFFR